MKTKNNIKILSILLAAGIFITSCRKNEDKDNDTAVAGDHSLAESAFNDVNNIADEAASGSLSSYLTPNNTDEKAFFDMIGS